jgi:hypothetical protein
MRSARSLSLAALALAAAVAGCSAEVIPASGRVFIYPRPAPGVTTLTGPGAFDRAAFFVDGLKEVRSVPGPVDASPPSKNELTSIEWSLEGGRFGDTVERVLTIALYKEDVCITAKRVSLVVPWSGAKKLEVDIPADCGSAVVPGTRACDIAKLPIEWVDVTTLPAGRTQ